MRDEECRSSSPSRRKDAIDCLVSATYNLYWQAASHSHCVIQLPVFSQHLQRDTQLLIGRSLTTPRKDSPFWEKHDNLKAGLSQTTVD